MKILCMISYGTRVLPIQIVNMLPSKREIAIVSINHGVWF